jgi:hypothetical protein
VCVRSVDDTHGIQPWPLASFSKPPAALRSGGTFRMYSIPSSLLHLQQGAPYQSHPTTVASRRPFVPSCVTLRCVVAASIS